MNELNDLNLDAMRAELAYRKSLLTGDGYRARRSTRRWWHRIALVPREHH